MTETILHGIKLVADPRAGSTVYVVPALTRSPGETQEQLERRILHGTIIIRHVLVQQ